MHCNNASLFIRIYEVILNDGHNLLLNRLYILSILLNYAFGFYIIYLYIYNGNHKCTELIPSHMLLYVHVNIKKILYTHNIFTLTSSAHGQP